MHELVRQVVGESKLIGFGYKCAVRTVKHSYGRQAKGADALCA